MANWPRFKTSFVTRRLGVAVTDELFTPWELLDPAQMPFKGNWSPLKLFFVWRIDQCAKYYHCSMKSSAKP